MDQLTFTFYAPIPVGHHVTVRALEAAVVDEGRIAFYSRTGRVLLRDDDTGIVYCSPEDVTWVDPVSLTLRGLGGGYRAAEKSLGGVVVACVVGSRSSDDPACLVTQLVVERSPEGTPYRTAGA